MLSRTRGKITRIIFLVNQGCILATIIFAPPPFFPQDPRLTNRVFLQGYARGNFGFKIILSKVDNLILGTVDHFIGGTVDQFKPGTVDNFKLGTVDKFKLGTVDNLN